MGHGGLVKDILLAIGSRPDCRVWQNNTGAAKTFYGGYIKFGRKGSCDIIGLTSDGRFLGIEVKVGKDKLSDDQKTFAKVINLFSGRVIEARDTLSVVGFLDSLNLPKIDLTA